MIFIGYKIIVQGSVVILIFAYVALGPYSYIYQQATDQIKSPLNTAYYTVRNGVTDLWLLVTNPTAWYAKQQVTNANPEKPMSFPKAA